MSETYFSRFDNIGGRNFIQRETKDGETLRETWYMSDDEVSTRLNTLTAERDAALARVDAMRAALVYIKDVSRNGHMKSKFRDAVYKIMSICDNALTSTPQPPADPEAVMPMSAYQIALAKVGADGATEADWREYRKQAELLRTSMSSNATSGVDLREGKRL